MNAKRALCNVAAHRAYFRRTRISIVRVRPLSTCAIGRYLLFGQLSLGAYAARLQNDCVVWLLGSVKVCVLFNQRLLPNHNFFSLNKPATKFYSESVEG